MKLPGSVRFFIRVFFRESVREEITGDLEEEMAAAGGSRNAFWTELRLIRTTLLFLRYGYVWKKSAQLNSSVMLFMTSFKSAWRNVKKDRSGLILNVLGLTVGFVLSMIIYLQLYHELTYDRWHEKADRIYRVTHDETMSATSTRHLATVGPPVGPALHTEYDQVENFVRFRHGHTRAVRHQSTSFYEDRIFYIDSTLFSVFDYKLMHGDAVTAMKEPNSVLLTRETAKKYFGKENPVGQTLAIGDESFRVTAVFDRIPDNTHLKFDLVIPFHAFKVPFGYPVTLNEWGWISFHTYVLLREEADPVAVEASLVDFIKTHWEERRWDAFRFRLQPLTEIYLGDVRSEVVASGNWNNIYAFALAAILLLLLIVFNYTNLTVARSLSRTKEVGVRKTLGASKGVLKIQFLMEAVLLALLAIFLSGVLLVPALRFLQNFLGTGFWLPEDSQGWIVLWPVIPLAVLTGVIAGLYPAWIMSRVKIIAALTRQISGGQFGLNVRKALVTIQFMITIALISGSMVIYQQINYLRQKDLGFDKSALAVLRVSGPELVREYEALKNQLLTISRVEGVSVGGGRMDGDNGNVPVKTDNMEESRPMFIQAVDYGFFETLGIKLVAGREFSRVHATDSAEAIIVNETAVNLMGYRTSEEALGKNIQVSDLRQGKIIGVVEDYHFSSLHYSIGPLVVFYPRTYLEDVYVRFKPGDMLGLVNAVESKWRDQFPELPFDLIFLEDHLNQLYQSDITFARLFQLLTFITMIIACLGLYALISLITSQKLKELSIRKVLGATSRTLLIHLFRPFALYILMALLIISPVAYLLLRSWLNNYAYTVQLHWVWFLVAGLIVFVTAFLATAGHSLHLARINPARILRRE